MFWCFFSKLVPSVVRCFPTFEFETVDNMGKKRLSIGSYYLCSLMFINLPFSFYPNFSKDQERGVWRIVHDLWWAWELCNSSVYTLTLALTFNFQTYFHHNWELLNGIIMYPRCMIIDHWIFISYFMFTLTY